MIEVPISFEMLESARDNAEKLGVLKQSFMKGQGNFVGCLGEEIVLKALPGSARENTYNFDISYSGSRLEVKTKKTTAAPLPHYMCSVSNHNTRQAADFYCFCRILFTGGWPEKGWVLGYMPKAQFFDRAVFMKKGEKEGDNGYIVKNDCHSVKISELYGLDSLGLVVGDQS